MMVSIADQPSPVEQFQLEALNKAFREVLASAAGKRVIYWMLEQCAIYNDAYSGDNNATNYTLGRQSSGRRLLEKLDELDPRFYPQLLMDIAEIKAMDRAAAERAAVNTETDNVD